jgi:hypothetical protein
MSLVTTDPAPMTLLSPMVTPGVMVTDPPSHTLLPIVTGSASSRPSSRRSMSIAWLGEAVAADGDLAAADDEKVGVDECAVADGESHAVVDTDGWANVDVFACAGHKFGEEAACFCRVVVVDAVEGRACGVGAPGELLEGGGGAVANPVARDKVL